MTRPFAGAYMYLSYEQMSKFSVNLFKSYRAPDKVLGQRVLFALDIFGILMFLFANIYRVLVLL
jgi:hypothetical protein